VSVTILFGVLLSPSSDRSKWWYGTLWFHYDELDTTVQDEVKKITRDLLLGDGLSNLNLYLNLIEQGLTRTVVSQRYYKLSGGCTTL